MKKKLLILINSDLFVRNYIYTNSFKYLIKKFDCYFIGSKNDILNKKKFRLKISNNKFLGFIDYSKNKISKFEKFIYKNFLINKNKSNTISHIISNRNKMKLIWQGDDFVKIFYMFLPRFFSFLIKNLNYIYLKIFKINNFNFSVNSKLKKIYYELKPDLVIFPMQGSHLLSYEILKLSKKNNFALIDNWDNLSSRGTHDIKPNYISVWGQQTKNHAIKYQNFKKDRIFLNGTPRFENYFALRNKKIKKNFKFKYILFLESFGNHNNEKILNKLDKLINQSTFLKNYKIVYRPHPWQIKNLSKINIEKFSNILIDPQILKNYLLDKNSTKFQPDINYYPSLIKNAALVVTGPTSMVIESTIFYKKTLLLGFSDKKCSYQDELMNYVHLEKLEKLNNIEVCKNLNYIEEYIYKLIKKKINKNIVDKQRSFYLFNSKIGYSKNLKFIIDKILYD